MQGQVNRAARAKAQPANILAAKIDELTTLPDKAGIHVRLRNAGSLPISAVMVSFYRAVDGANGGERVPCGGRGVDMIDWSDPMPGRDLYAHMRRSWIPPNGTFTLDGYPRCPGERVPLAEIGAELKYVMFDDGSGEGDARQIEATLRARQQARNERLKWMARFTALREVSGPAVFARSLYQELVDAARAAEIDPDEASRQGAAKPVREEMQRLALDIAAATAHRHEDLRNNEFLAWRITDLEQRTARLVRGAGKTDVPLTR